MTVTKFGNPIRVGSAAADPTAENGAIYYNSSTNILKFREDGAFKTIASREYADSIAAGFDPKESVRLGTIAALPAVTYANGASGVGATLTADANGALSIDGVAVAPGDRVLIKNQVAGLQNGIYVVTDEGDAGNPFILTRATDFDNSPSGEVSSGAFMLIVAGGTLTGQQWFLTTTGTVTIGTTVLSFSQASGGAGSLTLQQVFDFGQSITIADTDNQTLLITNNDVTNATRSLEIVHNNNGSAFSIDHNPGAGSNAAMLIDSTTRALNLVSSASFATLSIRNSNNGHFLQLADADNSNNYDFTCPNLSTDIAWTLPSAQGAANTILSNNGSGVLSWVAPGVADLQGAYEANNVITTDVGDGSVTISGTEALIVNATGGIVAYLLGSEDEATDPTLAVNIHTGDAAANTSGSIVVTTGSADSDSGDVEIRSGASAARSGDIIIATGIGTTEDGDISLLANGGGGGGDINLTANNDIILSAASAGSFTTSGVLTLESQTDGIQITADGIQIAIGQAAGQSIVMQALGQASMQAGSLTCMIELNRGASNNMNIDLSNGGGLDIYAENGVTRTTDNNVAVSELFVSSIGLTASTTAVVAQLTFDATSWETAIIDYKIREETTNRVRTGRIFVATNASVVVMTDEYAETADVGVTWSVALNGSDVELSATTTANGKFMMADIKKIPAG